ncbi:DUF1254 domain-containing protein [Achromobacter arsenitoxydans]|uniref:DUF1254 domain-containing protein n=1 Tax=Achromobacter arsenitoxydans SY8 TaxID=477184 RepID=H0F9V2_9BURK|nr:DUF1254 domain-containing protein [Achromobacter arsenitoxydans]EHK64946.1 hypothetical protein KYC_17788 [Achromobacter arsenitoxydans SY8]
MRRLAPLALFLACALQALTPPAAHAAPAALTPAAAATEAARQAAMEGYLYFYPLVVMDLTRRQFIHPAQGAKGAPANTFLHGRALPQAGAAAPWANPDMLRGTAWVDLTAGPVVLSVPDTQGRLYTLTLLDMWTDVFATLGKRSTGTGKGNTVIVPPGWTGTLPSGMARIDAPTAHVWAKILIQADGAPDYPAVNALQDGFVLTPLAQWNLPAQAARTKPDASLDLKIPVREQVDSMPTEAFFTYAAELLRRHPPHATDQPVLAQLRRVGLVPGRNFEFDKLDHAAKQGMRRGVRAARERMDAAAGQTLRGANGWQQETASIGVYGNAYLRRALTAQAQPGAGLPEDLSVLLLAADSQGALLDGAHRYTLHFESGQLPPADALWSLAAYDPQGMPVPNPVNRHALGSRDPLRYNPDGSLDLVFSNAAPEPEAQSNWLPIPAAGPVGVLLRIYSPGPAVVDGLWAPPAVRRDEPEAAMETPADTAPAPAVQADTPAAAPAASTNAAPAPPARSAPAAAAKKP